MYIQNFYRNNEIISEQHPNEHNPMFELIQHAPARHIQAWQLVNIPSTCQSALNQCTVQTFTEVEDNSVTNILLMNKENCALKLVDEIII